MFHSFFLIPKPAAPTDAGRIDLGRQQLPVNYFPPMKDSMKTCFNAAATLLFLTLPLAAQSGKSAPPNFPEEVGVPLGSGRTMFPAVRSTHELVGGGNNFVTEAGMLILRAGRNALPPAFP